MTDEQRAKIRETRAALRASRCTCPDPKKHDVFWIGCERTVAEVAYDNALAAAGIEL